jgi:hypothetical protein
MVSDDLGPFPEPRRALYDVRAFVHVGLHDREFLHVKPRRDPLASH